MRRRQLSLSMCKRIRLNLYPKGCIAMLYAVRPFCIFKNKKGWYNMSKEMSLMDMEQKLIEKTDNLVYELKQLNVVYQNLAKDVADVKRMIEKQGSRIDRQ